MTTLEELEVLLERVEHKTPRGKDYNYEAVSDILKEGKKYCTECGQIKILEDFQKNKKHPTGRKSACRDCHSKRFQLWRLQNLEKCREKDRAKHYVKKYKATQEEANYLRDNKQGQCEICREYTNLVLDHCHETGKLRGRLCNKCNSFIGFAKESVLILESAIAYLYRYKRD